MAAPRRPRILVSNDDGIDAPGLRALVRALASLAADVFVCAPDGERSAQSHAITLSRDMAAIPRAVDGAVSAYAIGGTPADAVMLALNSSLFFGAAAQQQPATTARTTATTGDPDPPPLQAGAEAAAAARFDLVVSGINRGDNCGLHVIYSGTVGAAREGAAKGVPSLALSLDDHGARAEASFAGAARAAAAVVLAALSVLRDGDGQSGEGGTGGTGTAAAAAWALRQGLVLNVNFPQAMAAGGCGGVALCHQGTGCIFPAYRELPREEKGEEEQGPRQHPRAHQRQSGAAEEEGRLRQQQQNGAAAAAPPGSAGGCRRVFRSSAGGLRHDDSDWCDTWAVRLGWTSVTPLSLRQDLRLPPALVPPAVGEGLQRSASRAAAAADSEGGANGGGAGRDGPCGAAAAALARASRRDCEAQEALAEAGTAAASEVVRRAAAALGVTAGGRLLPPLR